MTVLLVTQPPYTKFLSHIPDFLSKLLFRGGHLGISWAAPSQGTGCSLPWLLCCPSASLPPAPKHSVSPSLVPVSVRQIHHLQSIFLLTEKGRHGDRQTDLLPANLLPRCLQQQRLAEAKARSLEPRSGTRRRVAGPNLLSRSFSAACQGRHGQEAGTERGTGMPHSCAPCHP